MGSPISDLEGGFGQKDYIKHTSNDLERHTSPFASSASHGCIMITPGDVPFEGEVTPNV